MALSGLDIYKLLAKTNCRKCGYPTCLAFAMQLAKKAVSIDSCPHVNDEARAVLQEASMPPVRMVVVGSGERKLEIGEETVMFRHEEKFRRPCGIGLIIDDSSSDAAITAQAAALEKMSFERVGQVLKPDLVALRQTSNAQRFVGAVKTLIASTALPLAIMPKDADSLKVALEIAHARLPLVYRATAQNVKEYGALCSQYKVPLVVSAPDAHSLASLTVELKTMGAPDLVLEVDTTVLKDRLKDFTLMRRSALKKNVRSVGFPTIALIEREDAYDAALEAATYVVKYAGIVLMKRFDPALLLSLLTLRQNIYSDPQKPLQVEPKMYAVGEVNEKSPVLITTNFSLSYYTVLAEVEASRIPAYIMSVDTEGMSVLTAWAAEKFTPDRLSAAISSFGVTDKVNHKTVILPGYVAMLSGELEEQSGWKVVVGPKEAAQLPAFLKKLKDSE
jgi:acetyl-CoA decarbonylase/synthase, CODH/ACS complex subunit gamma